MKKKKFLTLAVATAIAGTTMLGVTSATSDYMHYQDGTITICDPNDSTKCITMKDRNEGATQAGVGCINYGDYCYAGVQDYSDMDECLNDDTSQLGCMGWEYFGNLFTDEEDCNDRGQSLFETCMAEQGTGMYGKHFQWGNNHGFAPNFNGNATFPGGESTSNSQINCSANSPSNPVNSSAFIVGYTDYCMTSTRNDNLRGGANDSQSNNRGFDETNNVARNVENRRGPCEDGYHVPSIGEWNQVLEYWAEENGIELEDDGGLKYNYTTLDGLKFQEDFKIPFAGGRLIFDAKVYDMGDIANLWSSSPGVGNDGARDFRLNPSEAYADDDGYGRAHAFSLRCFKDSYLEFPSSEGGDSEIIVNIAALNGGQNTCSGEDFIFPAITASPVVQTIKLAKKFQCVFGNAANKAVTLHLSGDLTDGNGNVISGENVKLSNPEWTEQPTGLKVGNTIFSKQTFLGQGKTLFNKTGNKIGTANGSGVEIEITVPGGTPDGTYNGVVVLTY